MSRGSCSLRASSYKGTKADGGMMNSTILIKIYFHKNVQKKKDRITLKLQWNLSDRTLTGESCWRSAQWDTVREKLQRKTKQTYMHAGWQRWEGRFSEVKESSFFTQCHAETKPVRKREKSTKNCTLQQLLTDNKDTKDKLKMYSWREGDLPRNAEKYD